MLDTLRVERAATAVDAALELEERRASAPERASAWERADAELAGELHAARVALRDMMLEPRVQEAIFLSSAEFYRNLTQHMERPLEERKSRSRQKEKTAAKYIQRFCAKNETISFYGPLAWGKVDRASGVGLTCEPGAGSQISSRRVSFEHWAVHRLAKIISRDPDVAPQLAPQLSATCHVEGATLFYPVARQTELDARKRAVIERCDGKTAWAEIIDGLGEHPAFVGDGPTPLEVAQELLDLRILTREILIPTVVMNPEQELLARVSALSEPARERWEPRLRALCEAAQRFAGAALAERIEIFAALGHQYRELTGDAPSRREGEMYAARTLLYEDCERNVRDLVMGEPIARRLESVAPLLDIARWVTRELPRRYQSRFLEVFRRLSSGLPAVDFVQFVRETQWLAEDKRIEIEMREEIEAAWREVIGSRWPAG
ncbi:MAG TPA: lantibiotic dehydratase, partial [Haliangium sp.]|nr:lantibiotic dehydratase [Haliangium sp.]